MKSFPTSSVALALAACWLAGNAHAQTRYPGISYSPATQRGVYRTAHTPERLPDAEAVPSLSDQPSVLPAPEIPHQSYPQPEYQPQHHHGHAAQSQVQAGCADGSCGSGSYCDGSCGSSVWSDDSCGYGGMGSRLAGCGFYAGASGLIMNRDEGNPVWLSFDDAVVDGALLGTSNAAMDWSGGFETTLGYLFNCGNNALELTYWGIFPDNQQATVYAADLVGNLNTVLDLTPLNYDNGVDPVSSVNDWFDGAVMHRLRRNYEFHNIELNFIDRSYLAWGVNNCGSCLNVGFLMGVRYLNFQEGLQFGSDEGDNIWGNSTDELYYDIDVENHLVGFQFGSRANLALGQCFNLYANTKAGIYGNHMTHRSAIYGDNGYAFVGAGPNAGEWFNIRSSKDDVAFLGELDLGASYQLNCNWRLYGGYRVTALTGVALTNNQFPGNFADLDGVANIDSNGSLLLHGAYAGLEFCW